MPESCDEELKDANQVDERPSRTRKTSLATKNEMSPTALSEGSCYTGYIRETWRNYDKNVAIDT